MKSANEVLHEFIETPRGHYPDAELEYEREIFRSDPSAEFARQIRQCVARKLSVRELSACIREHSSDLRDLDEEGFSVIDGAQQIINRVVKGELNEDEAPIPLMNLLQTRRLFG